VAVTVWPPGLADRGTLMALENDPAPSVGAVPTWVASDGAEGPPAGGTAGDAGAAVGQAACPSDRHRTAAPLDGFEMPRRSVVPFELDRADPVPRIEGELHQRDIGSSRCWITWAPRLSSLMSEHSMRGGSAFGTGPTNVIRIFPTSQVTSSICLLLSRVACRFSHSYASNPSTPATTLAA
jgi:hypothetical protein